jgi:hypothetical protein
LSSFAAGGSAFVFALVAAFLVVIPQGSAVALAVACSLYPTPKTVISTGGGAPAAVVEKSASLPKTPPNHLIPLPLRSPQFIFLIFRPKNACQAPKRPNQMKINKIELAL